MVPNGRLELREPGPLNSWDQKSGYKIIHPIVITARKIKS